MLSVSIVSGFLGAGKSTLLRRLLPQLQNAAVIVNEKTGVEAIEKMEEYLALTDACACCVSQPELLRAVQRFSGKERLFIETSGLSDPLPLRFALRGEAFATLCRLDSVLTLLDPLHFSDTTAEWRAQVAAADILAMGKLDLATSAQREACTLAARTLNSRAPLLEAHEITPPVLFSENLSARPRVFAPAQHSDFTTLAVAFKQAADLIALEDALEALPTQVFRGKGWVETLHGWIRFQLVGGRLDVELDVPPPVHGESRALFFGKALTLSALEGLPVRPHPFGAPFGGGNS